MTRILRSALFKRHLLDMTAGYRERAGRKVAIRFVDRTEDCIAFIAKHPQACPVYTQLERKTFRKWRLKGFPVSIFFRAEAGDTIVLEALYAHRMDIAHRFAETMADDG